MPSEYWGSVLYRTWAPVLFALGGALAGAGASYYLYGEPASVAAAAVAGLFCGGLVFLVARMFALAFDPGTFVGGKLEAMWGVLILGILSAVAIPAYRDYKNRQMFAAAVLDGRNLAARVAEFYEKEKRFPTAAEAPKSDMDPATRGWSVAYDVGGGMVVITMGEGEFQGRRAALHHDSTGPFLKWSCRSIDVESKLLPASCQSQ